MPTATTPNADPPPENDGSIKTPGGGIQSATANTKAVLTTPLRKTPAKKKKLSASNHRRIMQEQKKESEKMKQSAPATTQKKVMSEQEKKGIKLKLKKQRDSSDQRLPLYLKRETSFVDY